MAILRWGRKGVQGDNGANRDGVDHWERGAEGHGAIRRRNFAPVASCAV